MAVQTEWKKVEIYHFIDFHITSLILYRNRFKQLGDKIGIQTRIVSFCSVHFTESCFTVTPGNQCHWLHKNAIPSVFLQFPKHLQKSESKRKSPVKREFVESKTNTFEPSPSKIKKSVNIDMHIFQKKHLMQKLRNSQKRLMLCSKKFADEKNKLRTWKTC